MYDRVFAVSSLKRNWYFADFRRSETRPTHRGRPLKIVRVQRFSRSCHPNRARCNTELISIENYTDAIAPDIAGVLRNKCRVDDALPFALFLTPYPAISFPPFA